ncbi:hypothetical protein GCM10010246_22290 [Streptomyces cuspidosporus]|uniref:Arabinogalactan endo-beta-1,4-galactanase n=1 Tax=Streptomyces cuspidosporus TaxID=66882 RepID=A0ABN3FU08_9ACTN
MNGPLDIPKGTGVNYIRLRVRNSPASGYNNKAKGGKLLVDFHYSDTWADPVAEARLLSHTVPPGLVLPLSRVPFVVVADIATDRELTCVIRSFPNPKRWLSTLMLVGADTVILHRPSSHGP